VPAVDNEQKRDEMIGRLAHLPAYLRSRKDLDRGGADRRRGVGRIPRWAVLLAVVVVFPGGASLARADDGSRCGSINAAISYGNAMFGGAWAGQHRDGRNADWADCEVGTGGYRFTGATMADAPHTTFSQTVVAPDSTAWLVVSLTGRTPIDDTATFLYRADTARGEILTRLGPAHGLDRTVSWNAPLIDRDGNIYLGQELPRNPAVPCRYEGQRKFGAILCGEFMSFDPTGRLRWKVRTDGGTLGAQFTSDGNVVFQTWRGTLYVLDPREGIAADARIIASLNSFPEAAATLPDFASNAVVVDCLYEAKNDLCISANIISVDPATDAIFNTVQGFVKGSPDSFLQRWQYDPLTRRLSLSEAWSTDAPLIGGSPSSPDIAFTGDVVFVNDLAGNIYAIDATAGTIVAQGEIGYVPVGSNTTAPEVDADGTILGHLITFQRPMDLNTEPKPYMRIMRYRPGSGFEVVRILDRSRDGNGWLMRRNPTGGLDSRWLLAPRILFVAIATRDCGNCLGDGKDYLIVVDAQTGDVVSYDKLKNNASGTFSIGDAGAIIISAKPSVDGIGSVNELFLRYDPR
jgi:outer membrane protein assembly factor BamB